MTDQTTDPCPTPETHNWGCGCPSDVAAAIASCPGRELSPSPCRCPCYGCKHNCGAHNPETVRSADQTAVREQLLNAIDFSFCQSLGFGTPEGLLAAYEASRTQTVDQAALRETLAALHTTSTMGECEHCGRSAPCPTMVAVDTAVLPATTNHDTERRAVLAEAADRAEVVALRLRLKHDVGAANGAYEVMEDLRRHAAECPECGTAGACNGGPCPLRRVADETAATGTSCWCGHPEDRHWTGATDMTFTDGCHDCRGWNGAHVYGQELPWLPEGAEPAAGARQDGAQT